MGNRALVQFTADGEHSPVVYLHWDGDRVPAWLAECAEVMATRGKDLAYTAARFVGICHSHIDPPLSLGMWNADGVLSAADSHGDAGVFVVDLDDWTVENHGGRLGTFNARDYTATS